MTPEEVIGLVAWLIAMIVIVSIIAGAYKRRLAFQERKLEIMAHQTADRAARQASQNGTIEGRLEVLERIITDGSYDTARQIEALRGAQQIEAQKALDHAGDRNAQVN